MALSRNGRDLKHLLRVAFYYHSTQNKDISDHLMNRAVAAVRKSMPYAEIWHLRGERVPKHTGVDKDILFVPFQRIHHQAMMPPGPTLFLDIDVWVQKDIYEVFYDKPDAAVCVRTQYDYKRPETWGFPPYNAGVIFSTSQKFWLKFAEHHAEENFPWNDATTCRFIEKAEAMGLYIKKLPGAIYNYTPHEPDEDLSGKSIIHYKGEAKKYWMKHREC